ncbi:MAG: SDR family oxidoreductase [Bacteroidota bacterium]
MTDEIKGSIFITGAASGIGEATATLFHSKGWFVGLFDLNEAKLESLKEVLSSRVMIYKGDVNNSEDISNAMNSFVNSSDGSIDVLFNSAGVLITGDFAYNTLSSYQKLIDINLKGTINCIHHAIPFLAKSKKAQIINMSSASAIYGTPQFAVYSASKFGIRGLTEALNVELQQFRIKVCDVMPSFTDTLMLRNIEKHPSSVKCLGIALRAEDVAKVVWKSLGSKRVHHYAPLSTKVLSFISNLFPWSSKIIMKYISN